MNRLIHSTIALCTLLALNTHADKVYRLAKVNVKHKKAKQTEKLTKHGADVVNCKGIEEEGMTFLTDVLSGRDSIQINDTGNARTISMRGFGSNASANIKVLYNGISLNTIDLSGSDLNLIDTNLLGKIKIIPLSEGLYYGNNAVAGVISLKNDQPKKDQGYVSYSQGLPQYSHLSVSGTKVLSPEYRFNVSAFTLDNSPYRKRDSNQVAQGLVTVIHDGKRNHTEFFTQAGPERSYYPGSLTRAQVDANRYQSIGVFGRLNNMALLNMFYTKQKITSKLSTNVRVTHKSDRGRGYWNDASNPFFNFSYQQNSETTTEEPQISYKTATQEWTLGAHFSQASFLDTTLLHVTLNDADQNQNSEYIQHRSYFNHGLELDTGYRFVNVSQTFKGLNKGNSTYHFGVGSLGLLWHINPMMTWGVRRAGSYRLPYIDENSFSEPNVALRPQEGISYETFFIDMHSNWMAGFELYQLQNRDEIMYVPPGFSSGSGSNINIPKTKRDGLLINSAYMPTEKWTLGESIALMRNRLAQTKKQIPWTVPININLHSMLNINSNWFWVVSGHYMGKRYAISDLNNTEGRYGKFFLINTALIYKCNGFSASMRIDNITNRKYYNFVVLNDSNPSFYAAPGIVGVLTVSYTL